MRRFDCATNPIDCAKKKLEKLRNKFDTSKDEEKRVAPGASGQKWMRRFDCIANPIDCAKKKLKSG